MCVFSRHGCICCHEAPFEMYSLFRIREVCNSFLLFGCFNFMAVNEIKKHLFPRLASQYLLPTESEEREVLGVGSISVAILPSCNCQDMKTIA